MDNLISSLSKIRSMIQSLKKGASVANAASLPVPQTTAPATAPASALHGIWALKATVPGSSAGGPDPTVVSTSQPQQAPLLGSQSAQVVGSISLRKARAESSLEEDNNVKLEALSQNQIKKSRAETEAVLIGDKAEASQVHDVSDRMAYPSKQPRVDDEGVNVSGEGRDDTLDMNIPGQTPPSNQIPLTPTADDNMHNWYTHDEIVRYLRNGAKIATYCLYCAVILPSEHDYCSQCRHRLGPLTPQMYYHFKRYIYTEPELMEKILDAYKAPKMERGVWKTSDRSFKPSSQV